MKDLNVESKNKYKWYINPIKRYKQRRTEKIFERILNYRWEHGLSEETNKKIYNTIIKGK